MTLRTPQTAAPDQHRKLALFLSGARIRTSITAQEVGLAVTICLLGVFFTLKNPVFFSLQNIGNILEQITFLGILAVGMTFVVISGQFDLSVGSVYGLTAIIFAYMMAHGIGVWVAMPLAVLCGAGLGLLNGLLVVSLQVPAIIVTLGTLGIYRGLAYWISGVFPISDFAHTSAIFRISQGTFIPWPGPLDWIPDLVVALIAVGIIGHLILSRTVFGHHVYAIGSSRVAAMVSGVRVMRVQVFVLVLMGITCALSAILGVGQSGTADPNAGTGFELDVIAAVIIGGVAINGGRGTITASLLGMLLIGEVRNGLIIIGVSLYGQIIVSGVLIIAAVAVDRFVTRRVESGRGVREQVAQLFRRQR